MPAQRTHWVARRTPPQFIIEHGARERPEDGDRIVDPGAIEPSRRFGNESGKAL